MKQKKYYNSSTLWVNFIILILSLFDKEFFEILGVNENTSNIILAVTIKIVAVLNIALRIFFTNTQIKFNDNESNS